MSDWFGDLGYTRIPNGLLRTPKLSGTELKMLCIILSWADPKHRDRPIQITKRRLMEHGFSDHTVVNALASLEDKGCVKNTAEGRLKGRYHINYGVLAEMSSGAESAPALVQKVHQSGAESAPAVYPPTGGTLLKEPSERTGNEQRPADAGRMTTSEADVIVPGELGGDPEERKVVDIRTKRRYVDLGGDTESQPKPKREPTPAHVVIDRFRKRWQEALERDNYHALAKVVDVGAFSSYLGHTFFRPVEEKPRSLEEVIDLVDGFMNDAYDGLLPLKKGQPVWKLFTAMWSKYVALDERDIGQHTKEYERRVDNARRRVEAQERATRIAAAKRPVRKRGLTTGGGGA